MTTVGSEISSVKSQQGMRIPHLTKLILKSSKFRPQVWSLTKRKSESGDGRGLSFFPVFSYHERPLLAGTDSSFLHYQCYGMPLHIEIAPQKGLFGPFKSLLGVEMANLNRELTLFTIPAFLVCA